MCNNSKIINSLSCILNAYLYVSALQCYRKVWGKICLFPGVHQWAVSTPQTLGSTTYRSGCRVRRALCPTACPPPRPRQAHPYTLTRSFSLQEWAAVLGAVMASKWRASLNTFTPSSSSSSSLSPLVLLTSISPCKSGQRSLAREGPAAASATLVFTSYLARPGLKGTTGNSLIEIYVSNCTQSHYVLSEGCDGRFLPSPLLYICNNKLSIINHALISHNSQQMTVAHALSEAQYNTVCKDSVILTQETVRVLFVYG